MALAPKRPLLGGAVELDHGLIQSALVGGVHADDLRSDLFVDGLDGIEGALALITGLVAIATLPSLGFAGGSAGRNQAVAQGAIIGFQQDFHGRVAAGIKDFASVNAFNNCHNYSLFVIV